MTIAFNGWQDLNKKLEKIFKQNDKSNMVDVPIGADLAEFFKTAEFNVIYRVASNRNILNTCVPNTTYSFYVLISTFILGFAHDGSEIYQANFVNKKFGGWHKVLTDKVIEIELPIYEGYSLLNSVVIKDDAGVVTINAYISKNEGYFNANEFIPIASLPVGYRPSIEIFGQGNFQNGIEKGTVIIGNVNINGQGKIYANINHNEMNRVGFNLSYKAV